MGREIKAMMVLKGVKQVDICRKLKVTPAAVSRVVSGKKMTKVREAIADALGKRVEDLWPDASANLERKRKAA